MHATLQQLRLFEAVARLGSFTRAAEEIHLSQPAVSIQIKRLEENIGQPLFEQMGKRIYLTNAGQRTFDACRDILARLRALEDDLAELHGAMRGPLQISVISTAKYFMPYLLGAFIQEHPQVEPRLTVTNRARIIERLNRNEDDLVIMGQVPDTLALEVHPFLENPLVVAAPPRHLLAGQKQVPLARIREERFLVREPGSGTRMAVDRLFAEHGLSIDPYMELGSSEAIKQGIMAGLGVAVLSLHDLRLELAGGHMVVLEVEGFPLQRRWYAAYLKGKKLSRVARAFLDFLLAEGTSVWQRTLGGG
jgi:DNA-binding transcriptional LysR family regulator